MRLMTMLAAAVGASQLFALPAVATTYSFSARNDVGTFTTGAASPVASGYFLLTDFDFTSLLISDVPGSSPIAADFTQFDTDAAFNPVLDLFINGGLGDESQDTGGFTKEISFVLVHVAPFQVDDGFLTVTYGDDEYSLFQGPFEVTSGLPSPAAEPGSWALMIVGVGGLGLMQRRRRNGLAASHRSGGLGKAA